MHCTCSQFALLEQSKVRKTGFTDPGRINQDRMEHARQIALRTAGVRDPVMQDQLLAESKAAVPAEMVREFQVAGLGQ